MEEGGRIKMDKGLENFMRLIFECDPKEVKKACNAILGETSENEEEKEEKEND